MKTLFSLAVAGCLAMGATTAGADSFSLNRFSDHVLPVLVQVDSNGKVTDISPAVELTPRFDRLLRETLDELITRPAAVRGKAIASQFVMKLGMQTKPRADGNYDASFVYLSSSPVPAGQWFWRHEDGHRLVLVNRNSLRPMPYVNRSVQSFGPGWQQSREVSLPSAPAATPSKKH
jgi:hypothetical protein